MLLHHCVEFVTFHARIYYYVQLILLNLDQRILFVYSGVDTDIGAFPLYTSVKCLYIISLYIGPFSQKPCYSAHITCL